MAHVLKIVMYAGHASWIVNIRLFLFQAHEEARMKPSVARKLNEKIRDLEAELEQLRTNKKVKELEKKVHVSLQTASASTDQLH